MATHHGYIEVNTDAKPSFYDVTDQVKGIVASSAIHNGIAVVYSQHTTCSIMIQEDSKDETYNGTKFLLQDLLDVFETLVPTCRREGQYLHPGPKLVQYSYETIQELPAWCLNTDAHLRSSFLGRSESIPVIDDHLELGEFGRIYFIDFDGTRPRQRKVRITVVGD
jgi:thiamine phosphate synthase YjbQ (UPF0047 family)